MGEMPSVFKNIENKYGKVRQDFKNILVPSFPLQKQNNHSQSKESASFPLINKNKITVPRQTAYDAINFLNLKKINEISNFILNFKRLHLYCSKQTFDDATAFKENLFGLNILTLISCIDSDNNLLNCLEDSSDFIILLDISNINSKLKSSLIKNKTIVANINNDIISHNDIAYGVEVNLNSYLTRSISKEDRIKIFLNCLYLNVLSKKSTKTNKH